ncbi:thioredoxin family protein [Lacunimicrobium album]
MLQMKFTKTLLAFLVAALLVPVLSWNQPTAFADETKTEPAAEEKAEIPWMTDLAAAKKKATDENKELLLFFTGSDWCGFCIKLNDEVLTKPDFAAMISEKFVPVELDFPNKKELPAELKAQNDELKGQFEIRGFPTICVTDTDLRLFKAHVGFPGAEKFREGFGQTSELIAAVDTTVGSQKLADISDVKVLNELMGKLPEDSLQFGWVPTIEKLVAASKDSDAELHATWSARLLDIQDKEYIAKTQATVRKMLASNVADDEVIAFLDQEIAAAGSRESRLKVFAPLKLTVLAKAGRFDDAIQLVDQIATAEWASERDISSMKLQRTRLLFSAGRFEEGREAILARHEKNPLSPERLKLMIGNELVQAGRYTMAIEECQSVMDTAELEPADQFMAVQTLDRSYTAIGTGLIPQAELMKKMAAQMSEPKTADRARVYEARAAILYRAAGESEKADAMIEAVVAKLEEAKGDESVAFGDEKPARKSPAERFLEPAKGTQGDALIFLAELAPPMGKVSYLLQAAKYYQKSGDTAKALELANKAAEAMQMIKPSSTADKVALANVQKMFAEWQGIVPANG